MTNWSVYQNIGTISNRGFEIALSGEIIKNKDWNWTVSADATTLKNKVIKLPGGKDILRSEEHTSELQSQR